MFARFQLYSRLWWLVGGMVALLLAGWMGVAVSASTAYAGEDEDPERIVAQADEELPRDVRVGVHCGTGQYDPETTDPEVIEAVDAAVTEALEEGYDQIGDGGTALDAVEEAIVILEDEPYCQAAKGAVFNTDARHQLDASIMEGVSMDAGAVSAIENAKNPIRVARGVMEDTDHVLLTAEGADQFAVSEDYETVTQDYFFTQQRWDALVDAKNGDDEAADEDELGTVGAIAVDADGNTAAATSTGGLNNKMVGRVGDSPIIGAGTWADEHVAVSATGTGEAFIRLGVAQDISAMMEYRSWPLQRAAQSAIDKVDEIAGGAVIALDRGGRMVSPATGTVKHGWVDQDGDVAVRITIE